MKKKGILRILILKKKLWWMNSLDFFCAALYRNEKKGESRNEVGSELEIIF